MLLLVKVIRYINSSEENNYTIWIIENKLVQRRYRFKHDLERIDIIVYRNRAC